MIELRDTVHIADKLDDTVYGKQVIKVATETRPV